MITPRVLINLIVFVAMGVGLTVWAVTNYLTFGFTAPPVSIVQAEFETSPGLRPNFLVTYLGNDIGLIGNVELTTGKVIVDFELRPDVDVPRDVLVSVRRRSAVGEPYADLSPRPGTNALEGPRLTAGAVIPLERTSIPLSYEQVFRSVDDLLSAVEPDNVQTLVHELALGLDGRTDTIRQLITDVEDTTTTFAAETDMLDQLTLELTRLTSTIAHNVSNIGSSIDNTSLLARAVEQSRDDLLELADRAPNLLGRIADLLGESRGGVTCVLTSLSEIANVLNAEGTSAALLDVLQDTPLLLEILEDVVLRQPDGSWLNVNVLFNDGSSTPVVEYAEPRAFPAVPRPGSCPAASASVGGGHPGAGLPGLAGPLTDRESGPREPDPPAASPTETSAPALSSSDRIFDPLAVNPLLVLLPLALIAVLAVLRPWRFLGWGRGGEDDGA